MAIALPTVESLRAIIASPMTDEQLEVVIEDAAATVEGCISSLDASRQAKIVKYWAADMLVGMGAKGAGTGAGAITSDSLGDASRSFAINTDTEVAGSTYKQMAINLDTTGCLRRLGKPKATVDVLSV